MLIVHATFEIDPANRDAVLAAAVTHQELCRAEAGCHRYDISADVADPGRFYVTELWEDDDALAAHAKAPHGRVFGKAVAGAGVKNSNAIKYTIGEESTLY